MRQLLLYPGLELADMIPPRQWEAFDLFHVEGHSLAATASFMSIGEPSAMRLIQKARAKAVSMGFEVDLSHLGCPGKRVIPLSAIDADV